MRKRIHFIWIVLLIILIHPFTSKADAPPNLDQWLIQNTAIANAIQWEFPEVNREISPALLKKISTLYAKPKYPNPPPVLKTRSNLKAQNFSPFEFDELLPQLNQAKVMSASLPTVTNQVLTQAPVQSWNFYDLSESTGKKWALWTESDKQKLRDDFATSWAWIETIWPKYQEYIATGVKPADFDTLLSTAEPANYPPQNLQWQANPPSGVSNWTVIPSYSAFDLYSKMVAMSLVLEIKGFLPGSLNSYSAESLREILDGTKWFRYVPQGPSDWGEILNTGHLIATLVLPAPPQLTLSFILQNKLLGNTRSETLVKVLDWERYNMSHVMGGSPTADCPYEGSVYAGGYTGRMPLSRIINGTVMLCPLVNSSGSQFFDQNLKHWTGGCGATSGFNEQVLRTVNIPAQRTSYGHFQNNFVVDNNVKYWMGHADDTYGLMYSVWKGVPEIPTAEVLVPDAIYKTWVVKYDVNDPNLTQAQKDEYYAKNMKAVAKPGVDSMLKHLPKGMLKFYYCNKDTTLPFNQSYLYNEFFQRVYPNISDLENMYHPEWGSNQPGVWQNIQAKVAALGGCGVNWN